jgi:hypothetical protein
MAYCKPYLLSISPDALSLVPCALCSSINKAKAQPLKKYFEAISKRPLLLNIYVRLKF